MSRARTSNKGTLYVVSAPSGAGKTTIVERLLKKDRRLAKTISHTTRLPRPEERSGRDYFFVTEKKFRRMIVKRQLVEWTTVYGNRYGTSRETIKKSLHGGKDVVLVIEARGARAIRRQFNNAVFVLILPPSLPELRRRISRRAGMKPAAIRERLSNARREIAAMGWYDYVVVNDRLPMAVKALETIIAAERLRFRHRVILYKAFARS